MYKPIPRDATNVCSACEHAYTELYKSRDNIVDQIFAHMGVKVLRCDAGFRYDEWDTCRHFAGVIDGERYDNEGDD